MKPVKLTDTWALQLEILLEDVYPEATRAEQIELTKGLLDACEPGAPPLTQNKKLFTLLLKLNRIYASKKERLARLEGVKKALSTVMQPTEQLSLFTSLSRFQVHRPELVGPTPYIPLTWFQKLQMQVKKLTAFAFKGIRQRAEERSLQLEYLTLCLRLEEMKAVNLRLLSPEAAELHCAIYVKTIVRLRDLYSKFPIAPSI